MLFFRLLEISVIHPAKCKLPSIREICICMLVYAYENEVSKKPMLLPSGRCGTFSILSHCSHHLSAKRPSSPGKSLWVIPIPFSTNFPRVLALNNSLLLNNVSSCSGCRRSLRKFFAEDVNSMRIADSFRLLVGTKVLCVCVALCVWMFSHGSVVFHSCFPG